MANISAGLTTTDALVYSSDATGNLVFKTNGTTTALTLSTTQAATFTSSVSAAGNVQGGNILTAGAVSATGNITGGNVFGMAPPNVQVFTSGTGTYTTPTGAKWLLVVMVGGGGGGGSGSTANGNGGGNGGNTTFGGSLTAYGGYGGGGNNTPAPAGGSIAQPVGGDLNVWGGSGIQGLRVTDSIYVSGGTGGPSFYGSGGTGGFVGAGSSGAVYGSGGGGGGVSALPASTGGAGAAGGYLQKTITSPLATYTYSVGAGGTAGTVATGGYAGGAGAGGVIIVTAYF